MQGTCPECEGAGEISVEEGPANWRGSGVYVVDYPCRNCDSTGLCEVEPTPADEQPEEETDDVHPDWLKHLDAQTLIDQHVASPETFGLVTG